MRHLKSVGTAVSGSYHGDPPFFIIWHAPFYKKSQRSVIKIVQAMRPGGASTGDKADVQLLHMVISSFHPFFVTAPEKGFCLLCLEDFSCQHLFAGCTK